MRKWGRCVKGIEITYTLVTFFLSKGEEIYINELFKGLKILLSIRFAQGYHIYCRFLIF